MEAKRILEADYLDIVFDRRNKSYGGYELRRNYNIRLIKSLLILVTVAMAASGLSAFMRPAVTDVAHRQWRDSLILINRIIPPAIVPPPQTVHSASPKVAGHFVPEIDMDDQVREPVKPSGSTIDTINGDGADTASGKGTGGMAVTAPATIKPIISPEKICTFVQQMPRFQGDINIYLGSNIHYPELARSSGIEGRVLVQFIVTEDGTIADVKAVRGIGGGCDEEAVRVVSGMPKWKPGKQNGLPVKVLFTLPIKFELNQ